MVELTDGVIKIRPFTLENAKEHLAGEDEAQVKWLSGGKGTLEGIRLWIQKNQRNWEQDGPIFNFAIFNNDNKLVGMVEANTNHEEVEGIKEGDANISYVIYPFARGKRYASKATNLITDFLKNKGIKRGIIRVNPENIESLNVPLRSGFIEEEIITLKNGEKLMVFTKNLN